METYTNYHKGWRVVLSLATALDRSGRRELLATAHIRVQRSFRPMPAERKLEVARAYVARGPYSNTGSVIDEAIAKALHAIDELDA